MLAQLTPSETHHFHEIGLLLALIGGAVLCLAGVAARRDQARLVLVAGLTASGALFCAGFVMLIVVEHWGNR